MVASDDGDRLLTVLTGGGGLRCVKYNDGEKVEELMMEGRIESPRATKMDGTGAVRAFAKGRPAAWDLGAMSWSPKKVRSRIGEPLAQPAARNGLVALAVSTLNSRGVDRRLFGAGRTPF